MAQALAGNLAEKTMGQFLDELASREPVPGGGSVAALSGALAASLVAMVCRLTLNRKGYEAVQPVMQATLSQAETLQKELLDQTQKDIDAYAEVIRAYALPKETESGRRARSEAIQLALKHASEVPLHVAELCLTLLELARPIAETGNKNAASDGGVGALMAEAGLRGAVLNVAINLSAIQDQAFVAQHRARITELETVAERRKREILEIVEKRL